MVMGVLSVLVYSLREWCLQVVKSLYDHGIFLCFSVLPESVVCRWSAYYVTLRYFCVLGYYLRDISVLVYSLRERCLQVVRSLYDSSLIDRQEIPHSRKEELKQNLEAPYNVSVE